MELVNHSTPQTTALLMIGDLKRNQYISRYFIRLNISEPFAKCFFCEEQLTQIVWYQMVKTKFQLHLFCWSIISRTMHSISTLNYPAHDLDLPLFLEELERDYYPDGIFVHFLDWGINCIASFYSKMKPQIWLVIRTKYSLSPSSM